MKKLFIIFIASLFIVACNNASDQQEQSSTATEEVAAPAGTIEIAIIDVTGMHCDGCVNTITRVLTETEGVESAKVSLEYEQAKVKFDASKANSDKLKEAIESKGYGVGNIEIVKDESQSKDPSAQ